MKKKRKIIVLLLSLFSFILINNVNALKLNDGSELLSNDLSAERFEKFVSEKGFDYWKSLLNSDYFAVIINSFNNSYINGALYLISSSVDYNSLVNDYVFKCDSDCFIYKIPFSYINTHDNIDLNDFNVSTDVRYNTEFDLNAFNFTNIFSSFNLYKFNSTTDFLFTSNYGNITKFYTVKFNIPDGASLELKDSKGNIISSSGNNTFSLESGNYTYSVIKSDLYISKENIELIVNKDMEINVELESKLNLTNYSNIFSKFYNYLGSVVSIIFGIEKPFFLIVLGVSVVIIIVLLIKKLLKGRF